MRYISLRSRSNLLRNTVNRILMGREGGGALYPNSFYTKPNCLGGEMKKMQSFMVLQMNIDVGAQV